LLKNGSIVFLVLSFEIVVSFGYLKFVLRALLQISSRWCLSWRLWKTVGKGSSSAGDKDPEPKRSHGRELMGRAAAPVPCGCLNTAHGVAVLHRYFGGSASLFLDENLDIFVN